MEEEEEEVAEEPEEAAAHSKRRKGNAGCLRAESYHFAVTSDKQTHTGTHSDTHTDKHTHTHTYAGRVNVSGCCSVASPGVRKLTFAAANAVAVVISWIAHCTQRRHMATTCKTAAAAAAAAAACSTLVASRLTHSTVT